MGSLHVLDWITVSVVLVVCAVYLWIEFKGRNLFAGRAPTTRSLTTIRVAIQDGNIELACTSAIDQVLQQVLPDDPDAQCRVLDTLWYQAYSRIEGSAPQEREQLH